MGSTRNISGPPARACTEHLHTSSSNTVPIQGKVKATAVSRSICLHRRHHLHISKCRICHTGTLKEGTAHMEATILSKGPRHNNSTHSHNHNHNKMDQGRSRGRILRGTTTCDVR